MENLEKDLQLLKNDNENGPDEFILDHTPLLGDAPITKIGKITIHSAPNGEGTLKVDLHEEEMDNTSNENGSYTKIGPLDYGVDDLVLEVTLYNKQKDPKARGYARKRAAKSITKPQR